MGGTISQAGSWAGDNPDQVLKMGASLAPMFGRYGQMAQGPLTAAGGITEHAKAGDRTDAYYGAQNRVDSAKKAGEAPTTADQALAGGKAPRQGYDISKDTIATLGAQQASRQATKPQLGPGPGSLTPPGMRGGGVTNAGQGFQLPQPTDKIAQILMQRRYGGQYSSLPTQPGG